MYTFDEQALRRGVNMGLGSQGIWTPELENLMFDEITNEALRIDDFAGKSEIMIDEIIEQYEDETFLKADGFDEAIIGVDETTMRLIYSVKKCIEILMRDMSEEDAMEYFSFNVSGSYVGEKTPIWCAD
jgi:hypothetical protein